MTIAEMDSLEQFLAAPKPAWCIPTDLTVMAVLIACAGTYPGHEAVCTRCAIRDLKSLYRALKRLEAAGWLEKHDGGYRAVPSKFPKAEATASAVGGE